MEKKKVVARSEEMGELVHRGTMTTRDRRLAELAYSFTRAGWEVVYPLAEPAMTRLRDA